MMNSVNMDAEQKERISNQFKEQFFTLVLMDENETDKTQFEIIKA